MNIKIDYKETGQNAKDILLGGIYIGDIRQAGYDAPYGRDFYYIVSLYRFGDDTKKEDRCFKDMAMAKDWIERTINAAAKMLHAATEPPQVTSVDDLTSNQSQ